MRISVFDIDEVEREWSEGLRVGFFLPVGIIVAKLKIRLPEGGSPHTVYKA